MRSGRKSILMAALVAMSSCSAPAAPVPYTEVERLRDDFTRRTVPHDDVLLPPPVEPTEVFPPEEEGGS